MRKSYIFFIIIFASAFYNQAYSFNFNNYSETINIKKICNSARGLDSKVLKLALNAYKKAKKDGIVKKPTLTIVDYSLSSGKPRMWIIDLKKSVVKYNIHVAHGKGSGFDKASSFSNAARSHQSSLGVFVTGKTYYGKHGESLYIHGLEKGINNNAFKRKIVVHSSSYVTEKFIQKYGRVGRSLGCFAINQKVIKPVINEIKEGSLIFAYYPDKNWLSKSKFLN